jgi:hypothetical protein
MALLLLLASGLVWPAFVHEAPPGGKTVIYKTPGPVSKPRVLQWAI